MTEVEQDKIGSLVSFIDTDKTYNNLDATAKQALKIVLLKSRITNLNDDLEYYQKKTPEEETEHQLFLKREINLTQEYIQIFQSQQ